MQKLVALILFSFILFSCKTDAPVKVVVTVNFSSVKDKCGNAYRAIQIGSQTWMVDNLKTVRYTDVLYTKTGKLINDSIHVLFPADSSILYREELNSDTLSYYWKYQGGTSQNEFGKLYTWYTVKNRNICPNGWHVPTQYDWEKLITFLGGPEIAGGKLKSNDSTMWEIPSVGASNSTNFTAIGGGYRTEFATYIDQLKFGMYWSATEDPDFKDCAFAYAVYAGTIKTYKVSKSKKAGLAVRCVSNK